MSEPSHHGEGHASAGSEHHFDGAPADSAAPDEPQTPGWLTLLGVTLVLALLFVFALRTPEEKPRAELPDVVAAAAASAAAPTPAAPDRPRPMRPPPTELGGTRPAGMPSGFPMARPGMSVFPRPPLRPAGGAQPGAPGVPGAAPAPHVHRPGEPPH